LSPSVVFIDLILGERLTAMSVRPPLLPLRHVEGFLILDVAREGLPPLLHQAIVALDDE
jgi:hypothetical protein